MIKDDMKFCKDCLHANYKETNPYGGSWECTKVGVFDLVSGIQVQADKCRDARKKDQQCGPDAKLFELNGGD